MTLKSRLRVAIRFLTLGSILGLSGCAMGPQMTALGATGKSVELVDVPHYPYEDYYSGPAALATVIAAQKVPVVPGDLIKPLNVPERNGLIQAEIAAATRSYGLVPYQLRSIRADLDLIKEVQSGHPVMVLLNLGPAASPVWRYAVVVGVDPSGNSFVVRSGRNARKIMSFGELLSAWHDGHNWAMVAARPEQIPVTAVVREWVIDAAPLEQIGKADVEVRADLAAVQRWPKEPLAWEALGNARYAQHDLAGSSLAFVNALFIVPNDGNARNNLAQVLLERNCAEQAETQINIALAAETDTARRAIYARTKAQILNHYGPSIVCPGI